MKETLKNEPNSQEIKELSKQFAEGKPLSADQHHFLNWHQKSLSNPHMDSIVKYYLNHMHHPYSEEHSFLLPHEVLNKEDIKSLKRRLLMVLQAKNKNLHLKLTTAQFEDFNKLTYGELILYHGNQLITGAPFIPGGLPHIVYFQWGNLFGVAKYIVLPDEKALKSNVLIYFEDISDRNINECVNDYNTKYKEDLKHYQQEKPAPEPAPKAEPTWQPPKMGLSLNKFEKEEKK